MECLKSLSLALALCECEIEVERAVYLSRLEQAYQVNSWGSVEWYHDIEVQETQARVAAATDRKSTRLNSSHQIISYAVFCLKKKKNKNKKITF